MFDPKRKKGFSLLKEEVPVFLPPQQQRVYDTIRRFILRYGYPPSIHELNREIGTTSTSTMHYHLRALEKKGLITRQKGKQRTIALVDGDKPGRLPILGRIVAGQPLMALEDRGEYLDLVAEFYQPDNFVLVVRGDSMIEDGITDGDLVIVQRTPVARNGEVVVALVDGQETTLKRFFCEGAKIRLQPANSDMPPLMLAADRVQVQGKAVAVVRRLS